MDLWAHNDADGDRSARRRPQNVGPRRYGEVMSEPRSRDLVVVGVPIDCVGAPSEDGAAFGTELAPAALREHAVVEACGATDGGDLDVRLVGRTRDPATGVLGWPGVSRVTEAVRARVGDIVGVGSLPVLLGGCCTLLPGALAGARDAVGPIGLAYLDGHLDLYDGATSPTGEPADMPISVLAGNGPPAWSQLVATPPVPLDRLVLLGPRDRDEAISFGSVLPEHVGLARELTPADVRSAGARTVGHETLGRLTAAGGSFWVHLDVDVMDETEFPATDYLMPGGLTLAELGELLGPMIGSAALVGFSLACYNPEKDAERRSGRALVRLLAEAFDR